MSSDVFEPRAGAIQRMADVAASSLDRHAAIGRAALEALGGDGSEHWETATTDEIVRHLRLLGEAAKVLDTMALGRDGRCPHCEGELLTVGGLSVQDRDLLVTLLEEEVERPLKDRRTRNRAVPRYPHVQDLLARLRGAS